jgi:AraC family transcriptional regulator of adaptative response/methylated-DNA-[protein]-cysteine methyltransferase
MKVWQALKKVAAGTTVSYSYLVNQIGAPYAVGAVARAVAANPFAVATPCHRVIRPDGQLSGYRSGVDRKRILLGREAKI